MEPSAIDSLQLAISGLPSIEAENTTGVACIKEHAVLRRAIRQR